jgi:hypothetical protein
MGRRVRRASLIVGLLLYLSDLGSDIYVAVQYWKNDDVWWFGIPVIIFIVVPSIIVNITATVQIFKLWKDMAKHVLGGRLTLAFFQLSVVAHYIETIRSPGPFAIYVLASLRYLQAITESAPQLCLQLYVMLRQQYFPSYTLVSTSLSLLSLAWSITALEVERIKQKGEDFNFCAAIVFVIWQMSTIVSRISAIVIFAYTFGYYTIVALAIHCCVVTLVAVVITRCKEPLKILLSWLATYPFFFHSSDTVLPVAKPAKVMGAGYYIILAENIAFFASILIVKLLYPAIEIVDVQPLDISQTVAISCTGAGTGLSIIFFTVYHFL